VTVCVQSRTRPPNAVGGPYPACRAACGAHWYCVRPPPHGTGTGTHTGTGTSVGLVGCCGEGGPAGVTNWEVVSAGGCTCAAGAGSGLVYEGDGAWHGEAVFGTCGMNNVILALYCVGTDADDWRLDYSFSDCTTEGTAIPVSGQCDPWEVFFDIPIEDSVCCDNGGTGTVRVRVYG
jgi:hypothetical protein